MKLSKTKEFSVRLVIIYDMIPNSLVKAFYFEKTMPYKLQKISLLGHITLLLYNIFYAVKAK